MCAELGGSWWVPREGKGDRTSSMTFTSHPVVLGSCGKDRPVWLEDLLPESPHAKLTCHVLASDKSVCNSIITKGSSASL